MLLKFPCEIIDIILGYIDINETKNILKVSHIIRNRCIRRIKRSGIYEYYTNIIKESINNWDECYIYLIINKGMQKTTRQCEYNYNIGMTIVIMSDIYFLHKKILDFIENQYVIGDIIWCEKYKYMKIKIHKNVSF